MKPKNEHPWMMTKKELAERDRLHDLWATQRITKKQIERLESLEAKRRKECDILQAIH